MKNFHTAQVRPIDAFKSPDAMEQERFTRGDREYTIVQGELKESGQMEIQSVIYPADGWPAALARTHSQSYGAETFRPAENAQKDEAAFTKNWIDEIQEEVLRSVAERDSIESCSSCNDGSCSDLYRLSQAIEKRGGTIDCSAEIHLAKGPQSERRIAGYANTKNIDRYNEIIDPKAFRSSIKRWKKNGVILLDHDSKKPIGFPGPGTKIDKDGLWLDAIIVEDDPDADYAWGKIVKRLKRAFSVGFRSLADEWRQIEGYKDKIRVITDLDLYEVSVVTIPANIQSTFDLVKGIVHGSDLYDPALKNWLPVDRVGEQIMRSAFPGFEFDESNRYAHAIEFVRNVNKNFEAHEKQLGLLARLQRLNERIENG